MERIDVTRKELDFDQYIRRGATEQDYTRLVTEPAAIYENGRLQIVYDVLVEDSSEIVAALQTIEFKDQNRTEGMTSKARVFGFEPRRSLRKDFCSATKLATEAPSAHQIICDYAERIAASYRALNPELYEKHDGITREKVLGDYRVKESPFTSGIINKTSQLLYHFDSGNFKDVWSAMLVFRHKTSGGFLAVPEYDLGFALPNNSLFMFDGQGLLHGVTPIHRHAVDAFRYSIVFYSLRQMWNCDPLNEELARIRKLKTERERKRAFLQRTKEDF